MPQINIEFDAPAMQAIDALAAKLGIKRTSLIRQLSIQALDADRRGSPVFGQDVALPAEIENGLIAWAKEFDTDRATLEGRIFAEAVAAKKENRASFELPDVHALKAAVMELVRIAEIWAAKDVKIRKLESDDAAAMARARAEFVAGIPDRIRNAQEPFRAQMKALSERIDRQPRLDAIEERQRDHTQALNENTSVIRALEQQPRRVTGLVLGDGRFWSTAFICQWSLMMAAIGWLAWIPVIRVTSADAAIASSVLADDAAVCRLIKRRYERTDCQVPASRRVVLTGTKSPNVAARGS